MDFAANSAFPIQSGTIRQALLLGALPPVRKVPEASRPIAQDHTAAAPDHLVLRKLPADALPATLLTLDSTKAILPVRKSPKQNSPASPILNSLCQSAPANKELAVACNTTNPEMKMAYFKAGAVRKGIGVGFKTLIKTAVLGFFL